MVKAKERIFSIELQSKKGIKNITLADSGIDGVMIEGTIGRLKRARFEEEVILEVAGTEGILRIDLGRDEIGGDG
jgi:hypothetical protein